MPLSYKNQITGRVAEVFDPAEVQKNADTEAERLARGGSKKAQQAAELASEHGRKMAIHARHTIDRLDSSDKWQRIDKPEKAEVADAPRKRAAAKKAEASDSDS